MTSPICPHPWRTVYESDECDQCTISEQRAAIGRVRTRCLNVLIDTPLSEMGTSEAALEMLYLSDFARLILSDLRSEQ